MKQPPPYALRLLRAAVTPQVLIGALLVAAALTQLWPARSGPPTSPVIALGGNEPVLEEQEVRLVMVDAAGLERTRTVRLALPHGQSGRLAGVLAALRAELVQVGAWPAQLAAPRVFVETFERQRVAVIDMQLPAPVGASVAQELALVRSMTATAELAGATRVRFLLNGQPTTTLLGHVAVPTSL